MPDRNKQVAQLLDAMGDALEIKGDNVFKIAAYRKVARSLADLPRDVAEIAAEQKLREIPGVGEDIAKKIQEFLDTGKVASIDKEVESLPPGLFDILRIPDVGPKTVKRVFEELGIRSLDDFKKALESGAVAELPGMGDKKVAQILKGMHFKEKAGERMGIGGALPIAERIVAALKEATGIQRIEAAGSLRRWKETIGDIDFVAVAADPAKVLKFFTELKSVSEVRGLGETKASIRWDDKVQVQLRAVKRESWGAALAYFTGSKEHNIRLRAISLQH
ncbi:MAG: helix-hairpin-helix domain-containing protein, partial [Methylocella sp.]